MYKILKKRLENCYFFSNATNKNSEFPNSIKAGSKKDISCECLRIVENLPEKFL